MSHTVLNDALRLAQKIGDRIIIVNETTGTAHVLLPLAEYERIIMSKDTTMRRSAPPAPVSRDHSLLEAVESDLEEVVGSTAETLPLAEEAGEEERFYLEPSG